MGYKLTPNKPFLVGVRLSNNQYSYIYKYCVDNNISVSDFIRTLIDKFMSKEL